MQETIARLGDQNQEKVAKLETARKVPRMKLTHLAAAMIGVAQQNGETIPAAARRTGMGKGTFYKIIKGTLSPYGSIAALCRDYAKTPAQSRQIIQAHLLDEIERASMTDNHGVSFFGEGNEADEQLIRQMVAISQHVEGLRDILTHLSAHYPAIDQKAAEAERLQAVRDAAFVAQILADTAKKHQTHAPKKSPRAAAKVKG